MTKRSVVLKSGDTWEWDETPELAAFIKKQEKNSASTELATPLKERPKAPSKAAST